jgi:hypothetical protein
MNFTLRHDTSFVTMKIFNRVSIVTICPSKLSLIQFTMDARVVDLPEPVGPVTKIKPRGRRSKSLTDRRQS